MQIGTISFFESFIINIVVVRTALHSKIISLKMKTARRFSTQPVMIAVELWKSSF